MHFQLQCPVTGSPYSAHVEISGQVVARYWGQKIELACPLCREQHAFDFKVHYIAAAMADDRELMLTSGC